jgi:hypothetical protein
MKRWHGFKEIQKLLPRCERFGVHAEGPDQTFHRAADGRVIIHNSDQWMAFAH